MTQFVVTQTAREFGEYQKKQAKKRLQAAITGLILMSAACGMLYYVAWGMVNQ